MKRLLACAIMLILSKACGVEEFESDAKFISKTQATGGLTDEDRHRPFGLHANAYLINKAHHLDHPLVEGRVQRDNMTVQVKVGYFFEKPHGCTESCPANGVVDAGRNGKKRGHVAPFFSAQTPITGLQTGTSPVLAQLLLISEVNKAIDMWLDPLRLSYSRTQNPIVSGDFVHANSFDRKKVYADMHINFLCSSSRGSSNWPAYIDVATDKAKNDY